MPCLGSSVTSAQNSRNAATASVSGARGDRFRQGAMYCWEVAESEDAQQARLAARAVSNDDQFPAGEVASDLWPGTTRG